MTTPKPGEFWTYNGEAYLCIAANDDIVDAAYSATNGDHLLKKGETVWQDHTGVFYLFTGDYYRHWHHEPRCTGFDWVEPAETWPKWYAQKDRDFEWYIVRHSASTATLIRPDDKDYDDETYDYTWGKNEDRWVETGNWLEITEAEALARVTSAAETREAIAQKTIERVKRFDPSSVPVTTGNAAPGTFKLTPVDSPDDWVEITDSDHVLRKGLDHVIESAHGGHRWAVVHISAGSCLGDIGVSKCRCRRKDLPVTAVKRLPVRLWVHRDSRNDVRYSVFAKISEPDNSELYSEIMHDGNGFYVEVTE